jgi:hypothetical protein
MKFISIVIFSFFCVTNANAQSAVDTIKQGNAVLTLNQETRLWFGYKEGIACDDYNVEGKCVNPRLIFVADKPLELSQGRFVSSYHEENTNCVVKINYSGDTYEKDILQVAQADSSVKFKYVYRLPQDSDGTFIEQSRNLKPKVVSMPIKDEYQQPKVETRSVTQFNEDFTVCDGEYSSYRCDTYKTGVAIEFLAAFTPTLKMAIKCKAKSPDVLPNGVFTFDVINRILNGDYVLQTQR